MHYMQYNIYFRKDIWEKFKDEPEKSKVVNALLEEHYLPYVPDTTTNNNNVSTIGGDIPRYTSKKWRYIRRTGTGILQGSNDNTSWIAISEKDIEKI